MGIVYAPAARISHLILMSELKKELLMMSVLSNTGVKNPVQ